MNLEEIRKLIIVSIFSDNDLFEMLSLKGGNAIELAYKLHSRASTDIDLSMEKDFENYNYTPEEILQKIKNQLDLNFGEKGYLVFDEKIIKKPKISKKRPININWGGYRIEFKIVKEELYEKYKDNFDRLRVYSEDIETSVSGSSPRKKFEIEISKFEYVESSTFLEVDDYIIRVYTPIMVIFEKLRAICQQTEEYSQLLCGIKTSPRARDFYDIYVLNEELIKTDMLVLPENISILKQIFEAKKVPIQLLENIKDKKNKDFHQSNYASLEDTVINSENLKEFDFYYNYVVELVDKIIPYIKPLG